MGYKVNGIVVGSIVNISKNSLTVKLKDNTTHQIHISNVSDFYVTSLESMFEVGSKSKFRIISVDENNNIVKLDWKSIHPRFLKGPFEYKMKETAGGFKALKENTEKEIENA